EPSEATIRNLASLQEAEDEEEDDEGTAKLNHTVSSGSSAGDEANPTTPNRLSMMFDGWLRTTPNRSSVVDNRKSVVSEPKLVPHFTGGSFTDSTVDEDQGFDEAEFEALVDDLGFKGDSRSNMYNLPPKQKRQLIISHREKNREKNFNPRSTATPGYAASYGPAGAVAARLVPQLTGGLNLHRFSISNWVAPSAAPPVVAEETSQGRSSGEFSIGAGGSAQGMSRAQVEKIVEEMQPLQPQSTGGLWSSCWASSGGAGTSKEPTSTEATPKWYLDGLRTTKADVKLVKHMISLRVRLSTAPMPWIQEFVGDQHGMDVLGTFLSNFVAKDSKGRNLTEAVGIMLLETIKCLRVLLNADPQYYLSSPTIFTYIAYSLHRSSPKLRAMASDLLGGLVTVLFAEGHKAVLAAFSDYRVAYDESFRFQSVLEFLRLPDLPGDAETNENEIWEARIASMALINTIINFPDSLEDRVMLREEFGCRGLNEVVVALRYITPPDELKLYTDEKILDELDVQDRARELMIQGNGHPPLQ
ncbi:armadillo-type protein, partial [Mycena galopus ATCC 62051]